MADRGVSVFPGVGSWECSPGYSLPSRLQEHTAALSPAFCPSGPSLSMAALSEFFCQSSDLLEIG